MSDRDLLSLKISRPSVKPSCEARWLCSVGGPILTAGNRRTERKPVTVTLGSQIPYGLTRYRTQPILWDVCDQLPELYINIQSVPRSKHSVSIIKTSQLMLYRGIIAVCSQIHTKHINALCGQNVELLDVKCGSTYSNHWAHNWQIYLAYTLTLWTKGITWITHKDPVRTAQ